MIGALRRLLGLQPASEVPFEVRELPVPPPSAAALFRRSFGAEPPQEPLHFVATRRGKDACVAYVHFIALEPGVFLLGGLCVDATVYRRLSREERASIARHGSLARWLMQQAIARLQGRRAVFAYTGDTRSRRDVEALGFVRDGDTPLFVQWHGASAAERAALTRRIAALGPF